MLQDSKTSAFIGEVGSQEAQCYHLAVDSRSYARRAKALAARGLHRVHSHSSAGSKVFAANRPKGDTNVTNTNPLPVKLLLMHR